MQRNKNIGALRTEILKKQQTRIKELEKALREIKSKCDGNVSNENDIWHIADRALKC